MTTAPSTNNQSTHLPTSPLPSPLDVLDDFQRAFVLAGTRAEFNRTARLLLPFVGANRTAYEVLFEPCDCAELELWYVRAPDAAGGYFYSVCHAHRLQAVGRAVKCPRLGRDDSSRVHRRRKSGYTTARWYHQRGL